MKEYRVLWLFFKVDLCLAIAFKRSRRELSIDVAEQGPNLKNEGVVRILVIFQGRSFSLMWLNIRLSINKGVVRILVVFQNRPMFSHIIQTVSARAFH